MTRPIKIRGKAREQDYKEVQGEDQGFLEVSCGSVSYGDPKVCPWLEGIPLTEILTFQESLDVQLEDGIIINSDVMALA